MTKDFLIQVYYIRQPLSNLARRLGQPGQVSLSFGSDLPLMPLMTNDSKDSKVSKDYKVSQSKVNKVILL